MERKKKKKKRRFFRFPEFKSENFWENKYSFVWGKCIKKKCLHFLHQLFLFISRSSINISKGKASRKTTFTDANDKWLNEKILGVFILVFYRNFSSSFALFLATLYLFFPHLRDANGSLYYRNVIYHTWMIDASFSFITYTFFIQWKDFHNKSILNFENWLITFWLIK